MLKKLTLLAMAIAAVTALAAPALASATTTEWTNNGATLGSNASVHFEGSASFTSATLGTVSCASKATAVAELIAGGHNATISTFTDSAPTTDCTVSGFLGSTCGSKSLTAVNLKKHASGTGTLGTKQIDISGVELENKFGSCLTLVLTGSVVATLDSETAAKTAALSGELETNGFGKVKVSGDLNITAAESGKYGIKTF
jgi:hypothetical protein